MEKLDKKKVLAVVLIIALIAAFGGAVSILYNSIDMFSNTTYYDYKLNWTGHYSYVLSDDYLKLQEPLAIITLVAAIVAFLGVAAGVTSFIVKKPVLKTVLLIVSIVVAVAFLGLIIATACKWNAFYADRYDYEDQIKGLPNYISGGNTMFVLYTGVMTVLIPQLVYLTVIAAVILTVYIIDKKSAKKNAVETNDINSKN